MRSNEVELTDVKEKCYGKKNDLKHKINLNKNKCK